MTCSPDSVNEGCRCTNAAAKSRRNKSRPLDIDPEELLDDLCWRHEATIEELAELAQNARTTHNG